MGNTIGEQVARNLRIPRKGLIGAYVTRSIRKKNAFLEENAVRLCDIQPHHRVLEVGFGPGVGLAAALQQVKDGPGVVYGAEISTYMVEKATRKFRRAIQSGRLDISLANVAQLPYQSFFFDCVYHCNCFYFWPRLDVACAELLRVLKPGALMVTTMNIDSLKVAASKGQMKYANTDPLRYMAGLENVGFEQVRIEYLEDRDKRYQAIFAHKPQDSHEQTETVDIGNKDDT